MQMDMLRQVSDMLQQVNEMMQQALRQLAELLRQCLPWLALGFLVGLTVGLAIKTESEKVIEEEIRITRTIRVKQRSELLTKFF